MMPTPSNDDAKIKKMIFNPRFQESVRSQGLKIDKIPEFNPSINRRGQLKSVCGLLVHLGMISHHIFFLALLRYSISMMTESKNSGDDAEAFFRKQREFSRNVCRNLRFHIKFEIQKIRQMTQKKIRHILRSINFQVF